jgi:hypothetical protein
MYCFQIISKNFLSFIFPTHFLCLSTLTYHYNNRKPYLALETKIFVLLRNVSNRRFKVSSESILSKISFKLAIFSLGRHFLTASKTNDSCPLVSDATKNKKIISSFIVEKNVINYQRT